MATKKYVYWLTEEGLTLIKGWARDGLTDDDIAHNMKVSKSSLKKWKKDFEEIAAALKEGKELADRIVENALYKRCTGYIETIRKPIKVKDVIYNKDGKRVKETERIEYAEETVYIQPDVTAQMYWLNNRKPQTWRRKAKEDIETGGVTVTFVNPEIEEFAK